MDWVDHARRDLAAAGFRSGGAREAVLRLLAEQPCCLSAQQIFDRLRARSESVGLASVYRALDALATLQLVRRVDVDGTACYEPAHPSGHHHHHARCDACGTLAAFEDDALEDAIEAIGARLGYRLDAHEVVLRGVCPGCTTRGSR